MNELFARDPLGLTREERDSIIAALRADRLRFATAEAEGKKPPTRSKRAAALEGPAPTLDDLLGGVQS